jgi:hypothetical protein
MSRPGKMLAFAAFVLVLTAGITFTIGWRRSSGHGRALSRRGSSRARRHAWRGATGISYYDQAMFIQVIRTGFVGARKLNQIMPWHIYRGMTDEDIVAMFAYMRTLKPVRHHVDNTEPPTFCKICRQTHGGGNQN